jgi:ABC-type proline/glycine betaine transport system permease subunit
MNLMTPDVWASLPGAMLDHFSESLGFVLLALLAGVPVGWAVSKQENLMRACRVVLDVLYAMPIVGAFGLAWGLLAAAGSAALWPLLGVYTFLPMACYTARGIRGIDGTVVEACRAMGLSEGRIFMLVSLPQSAPYVIEGLRRALLAAIALIALGGFAEPVGLGALVHEGMRNGDASLAAAGGAGLCLLALAADRLLVLARWSFARYEPHKNHDGLETLNL